MEIFYLTNSESDKNIIDNFIKSNSLVSGAEFMQSFEWGDFLASEGAEIIRVGLREGNSILLVSTLVKKKIFNNFFYWYAPRGPIISSELDEKKETKKIVLEFFFSEIKKIDSAALFLRFEALDFLPSDFYATKNLVFQKTINLQPAKTLIIDLNNSEDDLLRAMHQKTRYNIRLAEKKGVIIKETELNSSNDLKEFWRLLKTTGERDNFRLHSCAHYEKLMAINKTRPGFVKLFLAQYKGKNIAGGIFSAYGNKLTYLHGASDNEYRNLMAPYLLQYFLIKKAQTEKYLYYDFYGIDEKKWPGVTRFKVGFGGREFNYAGTYDLIFKPVVYRFYEFLRKLRRAI